ncbi:sodium:proton antiporter [Deltaproteobacteria bacterium OttesenSCG-928-M10]|nr:sodium:proton antiporter [Deltaproteobacteria bacterium OttesenSCG-928-M10]
MKNTQPAIPVLTALLLSALLVLVWPETVQAAGGDYDHYHLKELNLSILWVLPFAGMLLSIALCPLIPKVCEFWHHHYGKVAVGWALVFSIPCGLMLGWPVAFYAILETIFHEYISFIVLLLALFTIAGGLRLTGSLVGTPKLNTVLILVGTLLASWMGTTGAAMLFIRPLLRAIAHRRYRVHTVVFFIFLVANIGGSLTPLGDPPLFLGYLKGVDFFWTTSHLLVKTIFMVVLLLGIYFVLDTILYNKEGRPRPDDEGPKEPFGFLGKVNFLLLGGVVAMVLISGTWKSDVQFNLWADISVALPNVVRDLALLGLAALSLILTPKEIRRGNDFTWEPIVEVAKLFFGIFITMAPAIAILQAGEKGALRDLVAMVTAGDGQPINYMYFWLTGALSSFLDNAPTYLVFFNLAGGDAQTLMHVLPETLTAISAGAVFMGANTYIGNAPNFMVRSIAVEQGVKMPSFFGYMAWSVGILVPLFILLTFIFLI